MQALAATDEAKLAERLATLGLQNRRAAQRLVALAGVLLVRDGRVPNSKTELETLPGVGPYVAAAYMSTVLHEPEPMVDVNMARLIERLYGPRTLADIRYDPHINGIAHRLIHLAARPEEFNWAVLDLGAAHCKARSPSCTRVPSSKRCAPSVNDASRVLEPGLVRREDVFAARRAVSISSSLDRAVPFTFGRRVEPTVRLETARRVLFHKEQELPDPCCHRVGKPRGNGVRDLRVLGDVDPCTPALSTSRADTLELEPVGEGLETRNLPNRWESYPQRGGRYRREVR